MCRSMWPSLCSVSSFCWVTIATTTTVLWWLKCGGKGLIPALRHRSWADGWGRLLRCLCSWTDWASWELAWHHIGAPFTIMDSLWMTSTSMWDLALLSWLLVTSLNCPFIQIQKLKAHNLYAGLHHLFQPFVWGYQSPYFKEVWKFRLKLGKWQPPQRWWGPKCWWFSEGSVAPPKKKPGKSAGWWIIGKFCPDSFFHPEVEREWMIARRCPVIFREECQLSEIWWLVLCFLMS